MNMTHAQPATDALGGRRIGVPESRELDLFAQMLERRGARVMRCPLVDIRDAPDPTPLAAWLDVVLDQGLDDMIWLTGEGVRRLAAFAARRDDDTNRRFISRLAAARAITRGPKPVRALRELGLTHDIAATEPTTAGVIDALRDLDLAGRRVGVQRYGTDPNRPLMNFLAEKKAVSLPVAPYVYADRAQDDAVLVFIEAIIDGALDAVAFTSSPQVRRLFKLAARHGHEDRLRAALAGICVAAVGPLVADTLAERGVPVTLLPESSYFMKPLVRTLAAHFTAAARQCPVR